MMNNFGWCKTENFNYMGGPWVGWAGLGYNKPPMGRAVKSLDSPWASFLWPSPAHSELWHKTKNRF